MSHRPIPFNSPYLSGKEFEYIKDSVDSKKISGNGKYTALCHDFFETRYGFKKCLLTTSCSDALEMSAILLNIKEGDEIIMPSYTFVSTANAFILRGATIIFCDSMESNPNMNAASLESLITPKTRAIVAVHYAGVACDMDAIMELAEKFKVFVVEDAAQAIDSFYTGKNGIRRPLGSIGHLAAFSFHETKNVISGEGGMLVVNDEQFAARAEIIWEKGTNRSAFFRGEIDKYGWVDIGSSFLPSDIIAAFLFAQLENIDSIQEKRKTIWNYYAEHLQFLQQNRMARLPVVPEYATNNAHMFYLVFNNLEKRTEAINKLRSQEIHAVFHYQSLHQSPFYIQKHDGRKLPFCDTYTDCLLRLPMYYELSSTDQDMVIGALK